MRVGPEVFGYLAARFAEAENFVRDSDPSFCGGFQTISMQAARLQGMIDRLKQHRQLLKYNMNTFSNELRLWRDRNAGQIIKGSNSSGRTRKAARSECVAEYSAGKRRNGISRVTKNQLSPKSNKAKVRFERKDYELRNKLDGLEVLDGILEDCEGILSLRKRACNTLEKIGKRWASGIFEVEDGEKLAMACDEVTDGSMELKEINEMLERLPETFQGI